MNKKEENEKLVVELKEDLEKRKARERSIVEGGWASVGQGLGHSYINPFLIALQANNLEIGILSSLHWIISPIAQLFGSRLLEKKSRKKIVTKYVSLVALSWLTLILAALYAFYQKEAYIPIIVIILYMLIIFIGGLALPAWWSWMGDVVPENIRGRYFSKRTRVSGTIVLLAMLSGAFLLDFFETKGILLLGFAILFLISSISRGVSGWLFKKQYEPIRKFYKKDYVPINKFMKKIGKTNFGKFVLFLFLLSLVQFIASPFFAVYMIRDLNFSYVLFTAITISTTIFTLLSLKVWGKIGDKYGNRTLIKIGSIFIPIIPLAWLLSSNPFYLIFVPQLMAGLGWGAFNLGVNNFFYDVVMPEHRAGFISYLNLFKGTGILIGGLIGSLITQYAVISFMNIFLFVFLVSGILRAVVCLAMMPQLKEIRKVKHPKALSKALFKEMNLFHFNGIHHEPIWFKHHINHNKK